VARLTNWAGNVTFSTRLLHRPASVAELQRLVAGAGRVRALGTGHSFSAIADSPGALVSVDGLPRVTRIDPGRATVTVSAGLQYGELAGRLDQAGWALRNLGSLPHISVAGACVTGTHGSGDANGSLATAVSALEMVTAGGDPDVRDAGLIAAAQRVEHYEIAAYGPSRTLAEQLDLGDAREFLDQTLDEEAQADKLLTKIATGGLFKAGINQQAAR